MNTVIIADDHPTFRKGLRDLLETSGDWKVIAEFDSGEAAIKHYFRCKPDIICLDISMKKTNGLDVAQQIISLDKAAKCVIMTMYNEVAFCERAMAIGVSGFLVKDATASEILLCFNKVMQNESYISNSLGPITKDCAEETTFVKAPELILSKKELNILSAIGHLKTNQQIAKELSLSLRTVQNHRQNISNKLSLNGRQALLQYAIEWVKP